MQHNIQRGPSFWQHPQHCACLRRRRAEYAWADATQNHGSTIQQGCFPYNQVIAPKGFYNFSTTLVSCCGAGNTCGVFCSVGILPMGSACTFALFVFTVRVTKDSCDTDSPRDIRHKPCRGPPSYAQSKNPDAVDAFQIRLRRPDGREICPGANPAACLKPVTNQLYEGVLMNCGSKFMEAQDFGPPGCIYSQFRLGDSAKRRVEQSCVVAPLHASLPCHRPPPSGLPLPVLAHTAAFSCAPLMLQLPDS